MVSAYAPQTGRQEFFRDVLRPRIDNKTVLGIDANCVMDVALDIRSHAQRQPNHGGRELAQVVAEAGLVDVMRERLEMERRLCHLTGKIKVPTPPPRAASSAAAAAREAVLSPSMAREPPSR